jgi:propanol-preferring alcohol dehydrogenase
LSDICQSEKQTLGMRAMFLTEIRKPLVECDVPIPVPGPHQALIKISACAVCRTDLHVVDGELPNPKLPLIPGHQIIGRIVEGRDVRSAPSSRFKPGTRVGVPWLGWTDGTCPYCRSNRENLCPNARFTGYTIDGGYAEYTVADERFCFPIDENYTDAEAAPLMCAGLIGYRSLVKAGDAKNLGIYGFGSAAHIIAQVAISQGRKVYAFTRAGDTATQTSAKSLGASWAGGSGDQPPELLDAAIIFAPVGSLVPDALKALAPGGTIVCGGIHMSDIPTFPYELLWHERTITSVANLTRRDGEEFLAIAPKVPVRTQTEQFPLEQANEALDALRHAKLHGTAVLIP